MCECNRTVEKAVQENGITLGCWGGDPRTSTMRGGAYAAIQGAPSILSFYILSHAITYIQTRQIMSSLSSHLHTFNFHYRNGSLDPAVPLPSTPPNSLPFPPSDDPIPRSTSRSILPSSSIFLSSRDCSPVHPPLPTPLKKATPLSLGAQAHPHPVRPEHDSTGS